MSADVVSVAPEVADLLVTGIGELTTNVSTPDDVCGTSHDAAVLVRAGIVAWTGPAADVPDAAFAVPVVDVDGAAVIPGFVDSHTHLLFGGDRS